MSETQEANDVHVQKFSFRSLQQVLVKNEHMNRIENVCNITINSCVNNFVPGNCCVLVAEISVVCYPT
jgi:hypothetical protein